MQKHLNSLKHEAKYSGGKRSQYFIAPPFRHSKLKIFIVHFKPYRINNTNLNTDVFHKKYTPREYELKNNDYCPRAPRNLGDDEYCKYHVFVYRTAI